MVVIRVGRRWGLSMEIIEVSRWRRSLEVVFGCGGRSKVTASGGRWSWSSEVATSDGGQSWSSMVVVGIRLLELDAGGGRWS